MKIRKSVLGATVALSAMLALTACGGAKSGAQSLAEIQKKYPPIIKNDGNPIKGGTLKVAIVSDSPLTGFFNPFFSQTSDDSAVTSPTMGGAVQSNKDFQIIQDSDETPLNLHIDRDKKTLSIKINPKFKWNDGSNVTTKDIVKTFEICANKEYINASASVRFDGPIKDVEGILDYNAGKAKTISGLEVIDDANMVIHYKEMKPSILYGKGMPGDFVKASAVEGIPMKDLPSCDEFRKTPHSYGPFHIKQIVAGQSVVFEPNQYYYKGVPKVDGVQFDILPISQCVANMKSGGYDIYIQPSNDAFEEITALSNVQVATRLSNAITLLNFRQGHWDFDKGECVYEPDAKMSNNNLKRAMAMAIDQKTLGEKFSHGLVFPADSSLNPLFENLKNPESKGVGYDMAAAKKLLDEAGYKDVNGDGFREDPQGNPLEITYVATSGGETAEPIAKYYLQQWGMGDDGKGENGLQLNVKLYNDRLIDVHDRWNMEDEDSPELQVWVTGYTLGSDPSPMGMYGKYDFWNFGRYTTPEFQEALEKTNSPEALDPEKAKEIYKAYDKKFMEDLPCAPMSNRVEFLVVNNRVKTYDYNWYSPDFDWSTIELTAEKPQAM